jgi:hypothetical protein
MAFQRAAAATWGMECWAAGLRGENVIDNWDGRLLDICVACRWTVTERQKKMTNQSHWLPRSTAPTHILHQAPPKPRVTTQSQKTLRVIHYLS